MRNNYLLFIVFAALFITSSCKKNQQKPVVKTPICSVEPDFVSGNGFLQSSIGGNQAEFSLDNYGNVYTANAYSGTITIGLTTLTSGGYYLEKNDPAGKIIYVKKVHLDYSYNINSDSLQNVYLCYTTLENPYHFVINLDKYDAQGNLLWSKQIPYMSDALLPAITINNTGKIFMAIHNISSPMDSIYRVGYGTNLYVFDSNGNLTAKKDLSDEISFDQLQLIYSGNLYFMRSNQNAATFEKLDDNGNVIISNTLQYARGQYIFLDSKLNMFLCDTSTIKKLDANFNAIWQITTPAFTTINSDLSGNIYIAGLFTSIINFNPSGNDKLTAKGARDTYMAKFTPSGKFV